MLVNRKFVVLGVVNMLIPFLGIPDSWKYALIWLMGILIIFSAIRINSKKRNRRKTDEIKTTDTFAENSYETKRVTPSADEALDGNFNSHESTRE